MELPEDAVLAVAVGVDRHKNQYGNREMREVKRLNHNLDSELKGGPGSNGNSANDQYTCSTGRAAGSSPC